MNTYHEPYGCQWKDSQPSEADDTKPHYTESSGDYLYKMPDEGAACCTDGEWVAAFWWMKMLGSCGGMDGIWWNMMECGGIIMMEYDGAGAFFFFYGDGSLWFNQLGVDSCRNLYECWYLVGITTTSHQIGNGKAWRKPWGFHHQASVLFPPECGDLLFMGYKNMIWYDMIWYDMIWYNMIWYDMIWYDIIWYDIIWYDMIWYDMIWYDMI